MTPLERGLLTLQVILSLLICASVIAGHPTDALTGALLLVMFLRIWTERAE